MMGSENHHEEAHLYASREEMESLILDDTSNPNNNSSHYQSVMTSLNDSQNHHPLSPPSPIFIVEAKDDPLRRSPQPENSYLEPPSYADVIFSPFDNENGDAPFPESPSFHQDSVKFRSSSRSKSSNTEYLRINVSDPSKEQEMSNSLVPGGNTYLTYLITTKTNVVEFGGSEFCVRRRFRDVVVLADRLSESYREFFIPPRLDKNVIESQVMQKQEFVEQRRVTLEKYLRRLAGHPVIKKRDELRVFLQVEGRTGGY